MQETYSFFARSMEASYIVSSGRSPQDEPLMIDTRDDMQKRVPSSNTDPCKRWSSSIIKNGSCRVFRSHHDWFVFACASSSGLESQFFVVAYEYH